MGITPKITFKSPLSTLISKWSQGLRISLGFILFLCLFIILLDYGYPGVSTKHQASDGNSLEGQILELLITISPKNNLDISENGTRYLLKFNGVRGANYNVEDSILIQKSNIPYRY